MKSLLKNLLLFILAPLLFLMPVADGMARATGLPPWLALVALLTAACLLCLPARQAYPEKC